MKILSNRMVLTVLRLLSFKVPKRKIAGNRVYNREILACRAEGNRPLFRAGSYIENQAEWGEVRFGAFNMRYSGCEIIAAYNALLSLGQKMSQEEMLELIGIYEKKGAVLFGGWGVSPRAIYRYFKERGYEVFMTECGDEETVCETGKQYDTIILTAYNDADHITAQIHTINVSKDGEGRFFLHNAYKQEGGIYVSKGPFESLWEAVGKMARGNAAPVSIIGINGKR